MWFICFIVVEVIMHLVPIPRKVAIERGLRYYVSKKVCKNSNRLTIRGINGHCTCHICVEIESKRKQKTPENKAISNLQNRKYRLTLDFVVKELFEQALYNKPVPTEKSRMYSSNHRAKRKKAVVPYSKELTDFVLKEASILAKQREELFGIKWQIDHMIPIRARNVRGLHVWNNFQCIPQPINSYKRNKLIYTNPHEWLYDIPKFFKVVYQKEQAT